MISLVTYYWLLVIMTSGRFTIFAKSEEEAKETSKMIVESCAMLMKMLEN